MGSSMKSTTNIDKNSKEYLTHEQEDEYSQAFALFDRDEDGLINPKELSILIRSLERNPSDDEIQQLIDQIVDQGNNLIDCRQFLLMMSILQNTQEIDDGKELREIFEFIDTDNNGLIDAEELRAAIRLLGTVNDEMKLTREEVEEMIAEIDQDKDGRLSFDEFASLFTGQT